MPKRELHPTLLAVGSTHLVQKLVAAVVALGEHGLNDLVEGKEEQPCTRKSKVR